AASQSALRRTWGAWSGRAETDGMRSHSVRSSRKATRCCAMYVRTALTALSTGWLMPSSLAARAGVLGVWYLTGRFRQQQPFHLRAAGQAVRADHFPGAHVQERGPDGFRGDALLFRPGEPVDGELERIGGAAAAGLPVDDLVRRPVPVVRAVDGVDAA